MDAELIAAAARLCGWQAVDSELHVYFQHNDRMAWTDALTDAGLLALEDALMRKGWEHWLGGKNMGYVWDRRTRHPAIATDRATAACMAAREELKHE